MAEENQTKEQNIKDSVNEGLQTDGKAKTELRDVTVDGYKFKINDELLDDVEVLEMIDAIENKNRPGVIVSLLRNIVGEGGYKEMKAYFTKKEGHFKISKLMKVYEAIFEGFDPKD